MSDQPTRPTGNYNICLDDQVAGFSPEGRRLLQLLLEYEAGMASQIPLYPAEPPLSHPECNGSDNDNDFFNDLIDWEGSMNSAFTGDLASVFPAPSNPSHDNPSHDNPGFYYNGMDATMDGMTDTNNNGFIHPEPQWAIPERERALQARVMSLDDIINEFLTVMTTTPAVPTPAMANLTLVDPDPLPGLTPPPGFDFDFQHEQAQMPVFTTAPLTFMDWLLATQHLPVARPSPFTASAVGPFMGVSPEEHEAMTERLNREVEGVRTLVASLGIARTARLAVGGDGTRTAAASRTSSRNSSVVEIPPPPPPPSPCPSSSSSENDDNGEYQDGDLTANYLEYLVSLGLRVE